MPTVQSQIEQPIQEFNGLNTAEVQILVCCAPMEDEEADRYYVPTKDFSFWATLLARASDDFDLDERFTASFENGLANASLEFTRHQFDLSRALGDQYYNPLTFVVQEAELRSLMIKEFLRTLYGGFPGASYLEEVVELHAKSIRSLLFGEMLVDPYSSLLRSKKVRKVLAVTLLGITPYSMNLRTQQGDEVVAKLDSFF